MDNNDFNIECLIFQQKIVKIFNEQKIPFLMKFYLFKQIWKEIKKQKRQYDIQIYSKKFQKEQTLSTSTSIPIEELKPLLNKQEEQEE